MLSSGMGSLGNSVTWTKFIVLYSHEDINNNCNSNTGGLCRFEYERVYTFLASVTGNTRRETQFLKTYANHPMLTPPHKRHFLFCLRYLPNNTIARLNGRKLNYFFSKSLNSPDHLFWPWRHPHSSLISCLGLYYQKWWLTYLLHAGVRLYHLTMHLD